MEQQTGRRVVSTLKAAFVTPLYPCRARNATKLNRYADDTIFGKRKSQPLMSEKALFKLNIQKTTHGSQMGKETKGVADVEVTNFKVLTSLKKVMTNDSILKVFLPTKVCLGYGFSSGRAWM